VIAHIHLSTRLSGSNVYLISLESRNPLVNSCDNPCSCTDSGGLKEESKAEQDVGDGVVQECDGESRSNELPRDGSNDGGDECSKKTSVEKFLKSIIDSKDVLGSILVLKLYRGYTSDEKHTRYNTELTSNHESRKVVSFSRVEQVTCFLSPDGISTLGSWDLCNSEESNLHTLEHTNNRHEEEEDDDCEPSRYSLPHGSFFGEESLKGNGETEAKYNAREEASAPEENILSKGAGLFVSLDLRSGKFGNDVLNNVSRVQKSREFDEHSDPEGE
jgi:hypothetical protein